MNDPPTIDEPQSSHRAALAFTSDFAMATLVLVKYYPSVQESIHASLDHTIWFHAPVNADKWHLHVIECEHSTGNSPLYVMR